MPASFAARDLRLFGEFRRLSGRAVDVPIADSALAPRLRYASSGTSRAADSSTVAI